MVLSEEMTTKVEAVMEHKRKIEELETTMSDLKKEKDEQQKMLVEATESLHEALGVKKFVKKQRTSLDSGSSS
jgi:chromosome segregation ATPase